MLYRNIDKDNQLSGKNHRCLNNHRISSVPICGWRVESSSISYLSLCTRSGFSLFCLRVRFRHYLSLCSRLRFSHFPLLCTWSSFQSLRARSRFLALSIALHAIKILPLFDVSFVIKISVIFLSCCLQIEKQFFALSLSLFRAYVCIGTPNYCTDYLLGISCAIEEDRGALEELSIEELQEVARRNKLKPYTDKERCISVIFRSSQEKCFFAQLQWHWSGCKWLAKYCKHLCDTTNLYGSV